MIEKLILDYLDSKMDVPVFIEAPLEKPEKYILIEKTGGGGDQFIASAMFVMQSYADTMYDAALLNKELIQTMYGAVEVPEISRVELNSDYNWTDTETREYRYQALFDIIYHR